MKFAELKKSPAWRQLSPDEKTFVRHHIGDQEGASVARRVRILLDRAAAKAQAQSRVDAPRIRLQARLPSGQWAVQFLSPDCAELRGEIEGKPYAVVLSRVVDGEWAARSDHRGPFQRKLEEELEEEFAAWAAARPNLMRLAQLAE